MSKFIIRHSSFYVYLFLAVCYLLLGNIPAVGASEPIEVGYRDFSYPSGTGANGEVTAEKPESKLWWNDGFWWGSMWSTAGNAYHIHRLDLTSQDWVDTGVPLDDRQASKADALWDGTHLYVVSHLWMGKGEAAPAGQRGELFRYSYNPLSDSYSLDGGFPVEVNGAKSETLVVAKDGSGTLWVTYTQTDPGDNKYKVWVNHSLGGDDRVWGTPYVLPVGGADNLKNDGDDIASIIPFAGHIGVMWSNQNTKKMYFAAHADGGSDQSWQSVSAYTPSADDHINLKSLQADSAGTVFAVVKTSSSPLILLLVCAPDPPGGGDACTSAGDWTPYPVYQDETHSPTRPILLIDTTNRNLYVFTRNKDANGHGAIYYKSSDMDNIQFPQGIGIPFIKSATDIGINDPTSTKQTVGSATGLVILASDSGKRRYFHNCLSLTANTGSCLDPNLSATLSFSSSTYSAPENAGPAVVTVRLSHPVDKPVKVDYATSDGTATAGLDYTSTSGVLIFAPDQTSQTFQVPIIDDAGNEPDETITLTLSNPDGATLGQPNVATLIINDDDGPPSVLFSSTVYYTSEGEGSATITVFLNAPVDETVAIDYATSSGTATAGLDYTDTSGRLTFAPGQTNRTFQVAITDDTLDEVDETVILTLSNPEGAMLGLPNVATLTIGDDDALPKVAFSAAAYNVAEGAGSATITVSLSAPSSKTVTVNYATSDGTATAGLDYTDTNGRLTFAPGQINQTFQVAITDDAYDEPDETAALILSGADEAETGVPSIAALTINDDDGPPAVAFSAATYNVAEGAGSVTITVSLSAPSDQTVMVAYVTGDGTATAGSDYVPSGNILTFAPGQASKTFQVSIIDDAFNEPDETILLTLSNPTGAELGTPGLAVLTIEDDDPPPAVAFSAAAYDAAEGAESATITVSLSASLDRIVTVNYVTADGTATAGQDYITASGSLTFVPGQTDQTFQVVLLNDALDEADETIALTLSNPDGATLGTPGLAVLTIEDDDPPPAVAFTPGGAGNAAVYDVAEGEERVEITVSLSAPSGKTVSVAYATDDPPNPPEGRATAGQDYTPVGGALTFAPGQTSQTFQVVIIDDALDEPDEAVLLTLSDPVEATLGALNAATLVIKDDDEPPREEDQFQIYLPLVRR